MGESDDKKERLARLTKRDDFIIGDPEDLVGPLPTMREWIAEVKEFELVELTMSPAEAIAAERKRRP